MQHKHNIIYTMYIVGSFIGTTLIAERLSVRLNNDLQCGHNYMYTYMVCCLLLCDNEGM